MPSELVSHYEVPFVPFPENPKTINIGNHEVYEYISPEAMRRYIEQFAERVDFNRFDAVVVNLNGGMFLFKQLASIKNYQKPPIFIEYHRPANGFGSIETIPVPKKLTDKNILIIDDIFDSGGVLRDIFAKVGRNSHAIVAVTKKGIEGQLKDPRIDVAVKIENVWVGGFGMDLGIDGEGDLFRMHPGIVVKK
jgi:hypoxanthine-guanine phosphoribosyltransferase